MKEELMPQTPMPTVADTGTHGSWKLLIDEAVFELRGQFLGLGSSRRPHHAHPEEFVPRGGRCSACRWTEVYLFFEEDAPGSSVGRYLVHTLGQTIVPGESIIPRSVWCADLREMFKLLLTWTGGAGSGGRRFTVPALQALTQAAAFDNDIRDALRRMETED